MGETSDERCLSTTQPRPKTPTPQMSSPPSPPSSAQFLGTLRRGRRMWPQAIRVRRPRRARRRVGLWEVHLQKVLLKEVRGPGAGTIEVYQTATGRRWKIGAHFAERRCGLDHSSISAKLSFPR